MGDRTIVSKRVLDGMIRAKMDHAACRGVEPLPVAWRPRVNGGCNWAVPGWTGESEAINRCMQHVDEYLRMLRAQFDIPEEA